VSFCEDYGDVMVGVAEEAKLVGEGDARLEHVMGESGEIMDFDEDGMWGAEFVFDVGWGKEMVEPTNRLAVCGDA